MMQAEMAAAAQAQQMGGYGSLPPMMGYQMMQNQQNGGIPTMHQQTNTESEGISEQPENLTDENVNKIDNIDENESNGETKSVSDTGNSSNASLSGMSATATSTNHVVPKTVVQGVVVCNKP